MSRPSSSMARVIRRGTERAGCEQGDESRNRYGGADRWRRACRPDARHGLGLARRRCHGRRASPGRGAAERQVQFDLSPLDGDLPPPRPRRKAAWGRASGGLSERRRLPHDGDGDRALPHRHPLAGRALRRNRGAGHVVADSGASAPDQSDLFRAHTVRARCGPITHPHAQPHRVRGFHAGRRWRHGRSSRCRQR